MEEKQKSGEKKKIDVAFERAGVFLVGVSPMMKLAAFGILILVICAWGTLVGWSFNRASTILTQLMVIAIPFAIIQNSRLKRKYEVKLFSIADSFVMGITGVVMLLPAFLGNMIPIKFFKWLWANDITLFISVPAYGLCLLVGYMIISKSVRKVMEKNGFPPYEIQITIVILYFICGWIGALIAWSILLVLIGIVLMIALAAFSGGISSGGTTYESGHTETWTEGYDEWGDKVYDSRHDG